MSLPLARAWTVTSVPGLLAMAEAYSSVANTSHRPGNCMLLSTCAGVALGDIDSPKNLTILECGVKDCADFLAENFGRFLQEKKIVDFPWRNTLDFAF
jgi:hypothetical protein